MTNPKPNTPAEQASDAEITSILTTFAGLLRHKSLEARRIAYNGAEAAIQAYCNERVREAKIEVVKLLVTPGGWLENSVRKLEGLCDELGVDMYKIHSSESIKEDKSNE